MVHAFSCRSDRRRHEFYPRLLNVVFVVNKITLGHVFPPSTSVFPCQYHSTHAPYSFIYHGRSIVLATDSVLL